MKVAEHLALVGSLPTADTDYAVIAGQTTISRIKWSAGRGAIEVFFGPGAGTQLNGRILWLMPTSTTGTVAWTCRGHSGAGGAGWYLPPQYLPSNCR